MGKDWKEDLASLFEDLFIIAGSKQETLMNFNQFCEFIAEPAFESMKDEYYQLRGWDVATGLQTKAKLEELELHDIAKDLGQRGLMGGPVP